MDIEYFDVVDSQDRPTGELTTKKEAHSKKIPHRCVAVFVRDSKTGKLWVQVREKEGGILDHTVGGHVSAGETYEQAVYREMSEEIHLSDVTLNKVVESLYSDEGEYIHLFGVYEITAPTDWVFVPNDEVSKLEQYDIAELAEDMQLNPQGYTGGFLNTMKEFLKYLQESSK